MRISDWSSDVCSSDLLTKSRRLGLFDLRRLRGGFPDIARGGHQLLHVRPWPRAGNVAISEHGRLAIGDHALDDAVLFLFRPDRKGVRPTDHDQLDRKSTRLNSSH